MPWTRWHDFILSFVFQLRVDMDRISTDMSPSSKCVTRIITRVPDRRKALMRHESPICLVGLYTKLAAICKMLACVRKSGGWWYLSSIFIRKEGTLFLFIHPFTFRVGWMDGWMDGEVNSRILAISGWRHIGRLRSRDLVDVDLHAWIHSGVRCILL